MEKIVLIIWLIFLVRNKLDNDSKESVTIGTFKIVNVTSSLSANVVFVLSAIFTICKAELF